MLDVAAYFGPIDIYLFDQILRGRIRRGHRVLEAGCGTGRNLVFFLREGFEVFALDPEPHAIEQVRRMAGELSPSLPGTNFRAEPVESSSFPDALADVVVSSAVLHFARSEEHFRAMLKGAWRLLKPGGLFFCRLASDIGMEGRFTPLENGRYRLLDGSERFLVTEDLVTTLTRELKSALADPLKTTVVQDARCMTTWVMRKG